MINPKIKIMGFNDFLGKLFGTKADRDMKAVKPYLQQIKAVYPKVEALSDNELRERSAAIKAEVRAVAAEAQTKIDEIKAKIEQTDFQDRAPLYAEIDNLDKQVKDFEPHLALDGGADGLKFYRAVAENLKSIMEKGGRAYFEIGYNQGQTASEIFTAKGFNVDIKKDYGKNDRCLIVY